VIKLNNKNIDNLIIRDGKRLYIDKEWLKEQLLSGKKYFDIACEIGCSISLIKRNINEYNLIDEIKNECKSFCKIGNRFYINNKWLIEKYEIEKLSITDIAKIVGCDVGVVRKYLNKYNISIREMWEVGILKYGGSLDFYISDEFMSMLDGLLISDGTLTNNKKYNSYFSIIQHFSKEEWIECIKDVFEKCGIRCKVSFRKGGKYVIYGKEYNNADKYVLYTQCHPFFTEQRKRWYNDEGKKIIPKDIRFDELMIANWMMGDGCLDCRKIDYYVKFATHCFNIDEIKYLIDLFKSKYNFDFRVKCDRCWYEMCLYKQNQVYEFCKMIEPYIVNCFKYKIRCLYDEEWVNKWGK